MAAFAHPARCSSVRERFILGRPSGSAAVCPTFNCRTSPFAFGTRGVVRGGARVPHILVHQSLERPHFPERRAPIS